ncbi:MAG: V-type ATP synthase subunit A [Candidatus Parvarchaeota archaeon]|nr:V-type ATP synthase subunit A [Candidatus Parvarchaeota archaeon]MCW1301791.1 V-type ATP synthase subunit A [Candidatus Parvarchaeota archaeon]
MEGRIIGVSGSVVTASGLKSPKMNDIVLVGDDKLIGEIVKLDGDKAIIQVYEETAGLRLGDGVAESGEPLSVELGPGLLGAIFDGIQRPLDLIFRRTGTFIGRGIKVPALDREKRWHFKPKAKVGDRLDSAGEIGEVKETSLIKHRILVPPGLKGEVKKIAEEGDYTIEDAIAVLEDGGRRETIKMLSKWPVRIPRPIAGKLEPDMPLVTGQRVIDTFFPVAKGGTAAVPGGFGTGKTVILHEIAKWADADIIVYCGTGERGNEMTEILTTFPELKDPRSGKPLMDRTIMIANTSNMPVAAREASVYTSVAIAEYYRDMGYDVALMADSTSRWAEALREISGRLEEMPGEEGYPAYLGRKISEFYERAGKVKLLNGGTGSVTILGAVSPSGGDISEPVSQNTLRATRVFWALDSSLADSRHFPAINWLNSYSLYTEQLEDWYAGNAGKDWAAIRNKLMDTLQREAEINEIVQLVGYDSLPESDKLVLDTAKIIRESYLQQNAFDEIDTFSSTAKQYKMLKAIYNLNKAEERLIEKGTKMESIDTKEIKQGIMALRYTKDEDMGGILNKINKGIAELADRAA